MEKSLRHQFQELQVLFEMLTKRLFLGSLVLLISSIVANAIVVAPTPGQQNGVSIDTTTTGSAVTVLAANSRRQNCVVQNQSGNTMFVTWDGTTASAINGWAIAAGAYFSCGGTIITVTGPISLFDSTAGDRYYVSETSAAPQ